MKEQAIDKFAMMPSKLSNYFQGSEDVLRKNNSNAMTRCLLLFITELCEGYTTGRRVFVGIHTNVQPIMNLRKDKIHTLAWADIS